MSADTVRKCRVTFYRFAMSCHHEARAEWYVNGVLMATHTVRTSDEEWANCTAQTDPYRIWRDKFLRVIRDGTANGERLTLMLLPALRGAVDTHRMFPRFR